MKKQELANKSGTEKKGQMLQGRYTQRVSKLGGLKLEDYFLQMNAESPFERSISIISSPQFSHSVNASQKVDVINHLQQTYGNAYVQRVIQAKLNIGQPGDKYEQEADRVAERVMQIPEPRTHWQSEEEKEKEEEEILQTKTVPGQAPEVTRDLESRIHRLRGAGQPLPESVRAFFEQRFGHDFSQVRIHADARATEMARSLSARAFTTERDIVFEAGLYAPETSSGKTLLAHELTHVLQQEGADQRKLHISQRGKMAKHECDWTAHIVTQNELQRHKGIMQAGKITSSVLPGTIQLVEETLPPLVAPIESVYIIERRRAQQASYEKIVHEIIETRRQIESVNKSLEAWGTWGELAVGMTGATMGVLAGSLIGGPVGAIIGGIIGLIAGVAGTKPVSGELEKLKEFLMDKLRAWEEELVNREKVAPAGVAAVSPPHSKIVS